jgi:hypothetical protein
MDGIEADLPFHDNFSIFIVTPHQELLKFSICNVPDNPFALKKHRSGAQDLSRLPFGAALSISCKEYNLWVMKNWKRLRNN